MSDIKFCCPNCGSEWKHLAGMTFGEIMSLRSKFQHAQIKIEGAHLLQGRLEEEIKGLKEDLERLREENEKLRARSVLIPESVQKIIDDYPAVCAERDRMMETVKRIDGMATTICMTAGYGMKVETVMPIYKAARAALEGVTEKSGAENE